MPRYRARHWIAERTHSWMNRFRRLLIRWEKKVENYIAMHFARTCITYKVAGLFAWALNIGLVYRMSGGLVLHSLSPQTNTYRISFFSE